ncbi:DUF1801 domain-containing protein [Parvularcula sp. LCG005]|uniref:DUF1801 domain-containing protein n=1 Tax=Parvularcula sp. LCG005 TaxID=3078805 RepID=UPI002942E354|nr:DUF1801 domain-containing protein [Parvularcula sp. LCG005]WOI54701.1 DUF1801 domain-containing protein [Parvularcula sp. LCG005]
MAENKTVPTGQSVDAFIEAIDHAARRADAMILREMMERISGCPAQMWGPSIIGFDQYYYKYDSGREGDLFIVGFNPRQTKISLHFMPGHGTYEEIVRRLGKHKSAVSCLYVNKLADVDMAVLEELVATCVTTMRERYDCIGPGESSSPA